MTEMEVFQDDLALTGHLVAVVMMTNGLGQAFRKTAGQVL
jgi:hypothetical protein